MDQDTQGPRAPTPFERVINEVSSFKPAAVLASAPKLVDLVCTDDVLVYDRRQVPEADVESTLAELNSYSKCCATDVHVVWRRARSFSAPASEYCRSCGARTCWCGTSRLLSRREA